MRSSFARAIAAMVVGSLVLACATNTSPAPVASPPPTGLPSASAGTLPSATPVVHPAPTTTPPPGPSEWPFGPSAYLREVGPDGTAFVFVNIGDDREPRLGALDAGGRMKPGWPIKATKGFIGSIDVGPDGSAYVAECGEAGGCVVRRLDASGLDLPAWPFVVSPDFACGEGGVSCSVQVHVAPDGTAYLDSRWRQSGSLDLIAVDPSGAVKPGWPVDMSDHKGWWTNLQIGPDGTVFMVWRPVGREEYPQSGVPDDHVELWAFAPDGSTRPGWPVPVPENGGYLFGPRGTVVTWALVDFEGELCATPRRTTFTVFGPDGRKLPGWPRGATGYASPPVIGADGTLYFVTAQGNAYAFDEAGEVRPGWPVAVPGALPYACGQAAPVALGPDGTIYALGDEVTARSANGSLRPGWPYLPDGKLIWPCSLPDMDTDCSPHGVDPAIAPDGTVYMVVDTAGSTGVEIVAIDRDGRPKAGWPYHLEVIPFVLEVDALTLAPDGRLFIQAGAVLLALDPTGQLAN